MLVFNLLFMIEKRGLKIKIFVFVINLLFMFSFVSSQVENGPPVILERYDENGSLIPLNNSNNNPPHFIKEVDNFTLSRETPLTVDLKDYFEDSDGDLLLYSVWGVNEVYITFEEDKMTLNLKERFEEPETFIIYVTDGYYGIKSNEIYVFEDKNSRINNSENNKIFGKENNFISLIKKFSDYKNFLLILFIIVILSILLIFFKKRIFRLFSKSNSNFEEYDIKPGESLKREYLSNKSVKNY